MNKTLSLVLASIGLVGIALFATTSFIFSHKKQSTNGEIDDDLQTQWSTFKIKYNKKFGDPDFEQYRFQVFSENLKFTKTNPTNYGVTQFMDLTKEEFKSTYLTLQTPKNIKTTLSTTLKDQNVEVDWVAAGATTCVKDQGQCGSCWSFSTTGSVESALYLAGQGLVSLSEQFLVDCSKNGNEGCNGGLMDNAFQYIKSNGITTEKQYPYQATNGKCQQATGSYRISTYSDILDCDDLLNKIQKQPISIAVDANNFQFYTGGVFSDCGTSLDHGVLLVGYSVSGQYWKVKNSWGTNWGESGYIRLASGNTCGLCNMASFPVA